MRGGGGTLSKGKERQTNENVGSEALSEREEPMWDYTYLERRGDFKLQSFRAAD